MSRLLTSLIVSAAIMSPFTAQAAGFGLPGIPGMGSKSSDSGSADLSGSQDQLVKQYVAANKSVMLGNASIAEALGLKTEAASLRMSGESLGDGATKGNLSDADKAISGTNDKIAAAMKNTTALDADSKKTYAAGLLSMAQGLAKYVGMKGSFESFSNGMKTASPMMLPKLEGGVYIVSSLPSNMKNLGSALSNAVAFAKSQNIEVSSDVDAATKSLKF